MPDGAADDVLDPALVIPHRRRPLNRTNPRPALGQLPWRSRRQTDLRQGRSSKRAPLGWTHPACGTVFQMDQTAPTNQGVLWHNRERSKDANLDRSKAAIVSLKMARRRAEAGSPKKPSFAATTSASDNRRRPGIAVSAMTDSWDLVRVANHRGNECHKRSRSVL